MRRGGRVPSSTWRALLILPVWVLCTFWMWAWWLNPARINYLPLFIPLTFALFYEFAVLPSVFLYFVFKAKRPPKRQVLKGQNVAVISLCVPSKESIDIVERQLKSMSEITYPHDSWILDEGNSQEVKALAKRYGVKHFSRKGVKKYNEATAPFKAKTKAGNVNAWLEHVKRRKYDYFVQLDIDHLPKPNYLHKTLGFFRDQTVAWVQAPSVYKNRGNWTARGSAEQELVLQGPLQMGFYGHSETPFIIGSHCTYRMSAIREIGGFQPTRAEDHLDTVTLASAGYKGVFLPEIIAEGDGPETLNTYLAQQFAWAYSMFQVLIWHGPPLLKSMPFRKKWQFLFSQTWYPLWSLSYLIMFMAPVAALVLGRDIARLTAGDFLLHYVPVFACSFLVWWSGRPLMQPSKLFLSWRGMVLHVVRWPIILRAVISASFKVKKPYMITPKGKYSRMVPTLATYRPFLFFGLVSASAVIYATIVHGEKALEGQTVFALTNAMLMLAICLVDIDLRLRQANLSIAKLKVAWFKPVAAATALMVVISSAFITSPLISNSLVSSDSALGATVQADPPVPLPLNKMSTAQLIQQISLEPVPQYEASPTVGLYAKDARRATGPYIQHVFADWNDPRFLAQQILQIEQTDNVPLVTLEPRGEADGTALLNKIASGQYDEKLRAISSILAASKRPVYVRFAHEMELSDLYPWGNQDPGLFIAAYRHVALYARSAGASNAKWVWSPAGNHGAERYYPGDDVVDVVGTTILYDKYWYQDYQPSFNELAQGRQWLTAFQKPVWVVEFGAGNADLDFQKQLIGEALGEYQSDGFGALVYLNIADSNISGPDYRLGDIGELGGVFATMPVAQASSRTKNISNGLDPRCMRGGVPLIDAATLPLCHAADI